MLSLFEWFQCIASGSIELGRGSMHSEFCWISCINFDKDIMINSISLLRTHRLKSPIIQPAAVNHSGGRERQGHLYPGFVSLSIDTDFLHADRRTNFLRDFVSLLDQIEDKYNKFASLEHAKQVIENNNKVFSSFRQKYHLDLGDQALSGISAETENMWVVVKPLLANLNRELDYPDLDPHLQKNLCLNLPDCLSKCSTVCEENIKEARQKIHHSFDGLRGKVLDIQQNICDEVINAYIRYKLPNVRPGNERHYGMKLRDRLACKFPLTKAKDMYSPNAFEPSAADIESCTAQIEKKLASRILPTLTEQIVSQVRSECFEHGQAPSDSQPKSLSVLDWSGRSLQQYNEFSNKLHHILKDFGVDDGICLAFPESDEDGNIRAIHLRSDDTLLRAALLRAMAEQKLWDVTSTDTPESASVSGQVAHTVAGKSPAQNPFDETGVHRLNKLVWVRYAGEARQLVLQDLMMPPKDQTAETTYIDTQAYPRELDLQRITQNTLDQAKLDRDTKLPAAFLEMDVLKRSSLTGIVAYLEAYASQANHPSDSSVIQGETASTPLKAFLHAHAGELVEHFLSAVEQKQKHNKRSRRAMFKKPYLFEKHEMALAKLIKLAQRNDVKISLPETLREPALRGMMKLKDTPGAHALLQQGVKISSCDVAHSALHLAIELRNDEVFERILQSAARRDINLPNRAGLTLLHLACRDGNGAYIHALLEHGANPLSRTKEGNTPLHLAVLSGNAAVAVDILLVSVKTIPDVMMDAKNLDDKTALYLAAENGNSDVVRTLLSMRAKHDLACGVHKSTPLQIASSKGHLEVVRQLLNVGASTRYTNSQDATAFAYALRSGHPAVAHLLAATMRQRGEELSCTLFTAIYIAAQKGEVDRVAQAIQANAFFDLPCGPQRWTPLQIASAKGHGKVVSLLLEAGANCLYKNNGGHTALDFARQEGYREIKALLKAAMKKNEEAKVALSKWPPAYKAAKQGACKKLVSLAQSGVPIDQPCGSQLWTPLQIAAHQGHSAVVEYLLSVGANHQYQNKQGKTALDLAQAAKHRKVIALLTRVANIPGARPGNEKPIAPSVQGALQPLAGFGPDHDLLYVAAENGDIGKVIEAIEAGVTCDRPCGPRRWTPLHVAASRGHEMIVELLLQSGAQTTCLSIDNETAFDIAMRCKHKGVAKLLAAFITREG